MLHSLEPCAAERCEQGCLQQVFLCFNSPNILSQHPACITVILFVFVAYTFCVLMYLLKYFLESRQFLPLYLWLFEQARYM